MLDIDWKFWVPLGLNIIGLGFMWYQTYLGKQQIASLPSPRSPRRVTAERQLYRRMYKAVAFMGALVLLSWAPYVFQKQAPDLFPPVMTAWGGNATGCTASIETSSFVKAADKYRLFNICRLVDPSVDEWEDKAIAISAPFTITGGRVDIQVKFSPSSEIAKKITEAKGPLAIANSAVLIPKNVEPEDIHSFGDARRLGGIIVLAGTKRPRF